MYGVERAHHEKNQDRVQALLVPATRFRCCTLITLIALATAIAMLLHPSATPRGRRKSIPLTLVADMRGNTSHGLALLANLDESNAASHLYRALDKAHNFENTKAGQGKGGGLVNGMWVEGYSHLAEGASVRAMVRSLSRPDKKTLQVCEIGFNGGHSAANYLILNLFGLHVRYLGFDLGEHPYAHNARRFLQSLFGDKVDVIWGDSERTLRDFYAANPNFVCDVAMVDGLHTYHAALADTLNFLPLTRNGSMIAIDDMRHPQLVEAWRDVHKACPRSLRENGCAANKDWCQSWRTASGCRRPKIELQDELKRFEKLKRQAANIHKVQGDKISGQGEDASLAELTAKVDRLKAKLAQHAAEKTEG